MMHQMLDHCVSDQVTQEAILVEVAKAAQSALDGAGESEVEESLWKGIRRGLKSNIQYMFVVDGLDQMKAGDTDAISCLSQFTEILSEQNAGSKMIAFTRPLGSKMRASNIEQFTMQTSQTQIDLEAYVSKMLSRSQFDGAIDNQMESAVSVIVNRSQGSFSWAEMAVAYAQQQRTLSQAISSVQSLPQTMSDLLDFHMKNVDFSQHETRYIMSWLAAAERPLLVEEVEQLLAIDPQGPSFMSYSHGESQWFSSLKPLVMTRDGVVSFAHTCIRDHIIKQARSASTKSPLNLREAHYDLLTRCLAWVQLSVREEAEISQDKLSMEERNHLFDKYVMLEYTARYWLSHLLSSPLVSDDGEFQFTTGFKKLVPATVLFARLELTCKESQFTRSSVVELYRLAADIRRMVLGDKSMALLQSLLFSSRVAKLAHASHADEHSYEAWRLSQELLGQTDTVALSCAEMMTQSFVERGTMTTQQEDIMKYLILTDSEITGVEFNQRLKYLGMVVGMYKSRGDNESALLTSKQFYQQVMQKYGTNSRQSNETAEFLTSQFPSTGSDEMSRDIARTKYDNMLRTMEVDDERRIKYTLYMAQMYEQQGETAQAQAILSALWAGLNSRDIDSVDMMDKKANVALVYYQFLRRQHRNESAELIIRELVADLETTGIHSEEMMQRVQLLRVETQEMHMYSMDRALAVLMWRYYKETGQEYTSDASTLALSLAEGMAATVSMQRSSGLSARDRTLMVELLDSIASSPKNLSVSTLILCHNLANIYVREGDWQKAGECSKAVLRHIWPSVEQAGAHKKFSTELAPPIADLALVLAYCHFRRLHLDQGTIVYENAFASLVSTDRVPVPSVLAVAKAVVEFYETTFQFTKALSLLHTVSNFLAGRLGETHKHTIDNLYLEAALADRLEMNTEAKNTYQRIYKSTCGETTISPDGIEAALALIGLYEKEAKWDSALDVYRHLWPTLVVQDITSSYDEMEVERLLEKTYLGYMAILTSRAKTTEFSERYKVASDYVTTCRNVYGPTDQKTLSALLLYAELCETNEAYTDQAIALYKQPLQTAEWVPTSQSSLPLEQMTQPLPITLKHKLAQLFVRKRDSTSEARSLYTEEYQLAKKTQGYFSTTTLSWLRELALAHSRQGTPSSVQQGNALLHTYVTDVLHAGGEHEMMGDWARKIASIYLECGFIEGGNNVLDELRHRVISGSDASAMALGDRRDAVFVASFEEVFGRRATSTQIMTEMYSEMQITQTFTRNLSGHDFIPTLISGDRLARLQLDQKRTRAAKETRDRLYEYFCATLSATQIANRDIVMQFYGICLREVHNENYNLNILKTTASLVRDLCNDQRFQDASDVTGVLHSFLHLTDGLNNYDSIITATKICLYLSGHQATKCNNEKLFNEMSVKSRMLLQELLASAKSLGIEMMDLPFPELNDIITLLGEYEMFDDLEAILTQLWTSRIVQRTWTPDVVVWIGRRLVETRFCRGSVDSAIQLCRDICYNLRQVWGSCDNVTLEMTKLLSGLFTASGDHKSAATLHEGVLYDLLGDSEAKKHPNASDVVSQHMELLRRAQSRLGTGKSTRSSSHADLVAQVTDRFGLQSEQIEGVGDAHGGDNFGVWSKPRRFSIDVEDLDDQGQMHHNHLRESSGAGLLTGSGAPRRISVQAL
jgi:tetratricopeptide (TPR) repeat protein